MDWKCFVGDKNYILKNAQQNLTDHLIQQTVQLVREHYHMHFNPLGLTDDLTHSIDHGPILNYNFILRIYVLLSGIYRRMNPDNQLEFLWDGTTQEDRFRAIWEKDYIGLKKRLCRDPKYVKAVIKGAFFDANTSMLEKELEKFILGTFGLKKDKRGFIAKAA